jgi:hypothetical protein
MTPQHIENLKMTLASMTEREHIRVKSADLVGQKRRKGNLKLTFCSNAQKSKVVRSNIPQTVLVAALDTFDFTKIIISRGSASQISAIRKFH